MSDFDYLNPNISGRQFTHPLSIGGTRALHGGSDNLLSNASKTKNRNIMSQSVPWDYQAMRGLIDEPNRQVKPR